MRPHLPWRFLGLLGITAAALALSGNAAASTCTIHTRLCQTLVIQAAGPLRVYVQAISCISGSGLSWDVRVTDGSRIVHVPIGDSPSVVPGRQVGVPSAGRWRLEVRVSNTDPEARCVRGETSTDPVTVVGMSGSPRPTPRPTARPTPAPDAAATPSSSTASSPAEAPVPAASSATGPVAPGASLPDEGGVLPPFDEGDLPPEDAGGSGEFNPLLVVALFATGVGGVELILYAIRRELKMRRQSGQPD